MEKMHCMIIPDESDPQQLSSAEFDPKVVYAALIGAKNGVAHIVINGERFSISKPQQVFQMRGTNGTVYTLKPDGEPVFNDNGRFATLRE